MAIKILILGGYGTFGGRLARLLADAPELTLLIAGDPRIRQRSSAGSCLQRRHWYRWLLIVTGIWKRSFHTSDRISSWMPQAPFRRMKEISTA